MQLKISDLEKLTGIPKATLRYYESIGLLSPVRREGSNYRSYTVTDLVRLVQVRQINSFGLQLSELPGEEHSVSCKELCESLCERERALEQEIEQTIEQLGRLRLHVNSFRQAAAPEHPVTLAHTSGNYRLFPCDPGVMEHPNTEDIVRKWIAQAPHTYSVVRVRFKDISACTEDSCPASVGIGLMKHVFDDAGDTFREPMQYSPLGRCIQGVIETPSLDRIPVKALTPFVQFLRERTLIPLEDLYGWVIYAPAEGQNEPFRVSMRLAVS